MKCDNCGMELQSGWEVCAGCGKKLGVVLKTFDTVEDVGEKTIDIGKRATKGALRFTGKAFSEVGEAAQKAGKKDKKKGN